MSGPTESGGWTRRVWRWIREQSMRIESREEWERVRARGHGHWILWQGIVGFAVPLAALILLTEFLTGSFPNPEIENWWLRVPIGAFIFAAGGYIIADRAWHEAEDRFG